MAWFRPMPIHGVLCLYTHVYIEWGEKRKSAALIPWPVFAEQEGLCRESDLHTWNSKQGLVQYYNNSTSILLWSHSSSAEVNVCTTA